MQLGDRMFGVRAGMTWWASCPHFRCSCCCVEHDHVKQQLLSGYVNLGISAMFSSGRQERKWEFRE